MKAFHVTIFLLLLASAVAAQTTLSNIPDPKRTNGGYVSNPDGLLDDATVLDLDSIIRDIEKRTTVQIAVVAVKSIGDADLFEFSQSLFTRWGIGMKGKDNGLLVLFVEDIRSVRFHTGYGLDGILPDVICKRIQRDYMVPHFKEANYGAGLAGGVTQAGKIVSDPTYAQHVLEETLVEEPQEVSAITALGLMVLFFAGPVLLIIYLYKSRDGNFSDSRNPTRTPYPEMRLSRKIWLLLFVLAPAAIILVFTFSNSPDAATLCFLSLYGFLILTLMRRQWRAKKVINRFLRGEQYSEAVNFVKDQQTYWMVMAILFPIPVFLTSLFTCIEGEGTGTIQENARPAEDRCRS